MKTKIIGLLVTIVVFSGCGNTGDPYLSIADCDQIIRSEYTNSVVTRLSLTNEDPYNAKWLVKTPTDEIIFFQRYLGSLVKNKIF